LDLLQPVRNQFSKSEVFDAIVREWLIAPLGQEMVACFYKVQDCVYRGDARSPTFETALRKFPNNLSQRQKIYYLMQNVLLKSGGKLCL
jgi:hypothetical protein